MCEKDNSERVSVGDRFTIKSAEVHFLNNEIRQTTNPQHLGDWLIDAYENKREDEIADKEGYLRCGYRSMSLSLQFNNSPSEVELGFVQYQTNLWPEISGLEINGDYQLYMPGISVLKHPIFSLDRKNGKEIGEVFKQIKDEEIMVFITKRLARPGPVARDEVVALLLKSKEGFIAEGQIWLIHNTGIGDTYNMLYELEKHSRY